jgi:glyoxalase family protein
MTKSRPAQQTGRRLIRFGGRRGDRRYNNRTMKLLGIHHITAIAGDPQRNLDFYRKILGLRFVKRTVNFDDPSSYHFYFGDRTGTPGTVITFFPWPGARRGTRGNGQVVATSFAIPQGSLNHWSDRLKEHSVSVENISRFDEQGLRFTDPDGLLIELIASDFPSPGASRPPRDGDPAERREDGGEGNFKLSDIRGFHAPTLQLRDAGPTQKLLTETLGLEQIAEQGSRRRFSIDARSTSARVDLVERPDDPHGHIAVGTVHHMAFRTPSDEEQLKWREKLVDLGFMVSPVMDREYFHSIYFREPGGILFEIATNGPGFAIDEPVEHLGESLKLPKQFEAHRSAIEQTLPPISLG